nr:hypothetical protein BV87_15045 [Sphingobium yanoikuyae]
MRCPPRRTTTLPAAPPQSAARAATERRERSERPMPDKVAPRPTPAPRKSPSSPPVIPVGDWPNRRLNASIPSNFTTPPTIIPPTAPPRVSHGRLPAASAMAIPRLTPAPPTKATAKVSQSNTKTEDAAPPPPGSGGVAATNP